MKQTTLGAFVFKKQSSPGSSLLTSKEDAIIVPDTPSSDRQSPRRKSAKTIALLRKRHNIKNLDGLNYSPCDQSTTNSSSISTAPTISLPFTAGINSENKYEERKCSPPCKKSKFILPPRSDKSLRNNNRSVEYSAEEKDALDDILQGLHAKPMINLNNNQTPSSCCKQKSSQKKALKPSNRNYSIKECKSSDLLEDLMNHLHHESTKSDDNMPPINSNNVKPSTVENTLSESFCELLDSSFCMDGVREEKTFVRCEVLSLQKTGDSIIVKMKNLSNESRFSLILRGFWFHTRIAVGDVCHVINPTLIPVDAATTYEIDDTTGYVVVNPDLLLSGTNIVQSMACQRRSILQHFFGSADSFGGIGNNKAMFIGTLVHLLFQEIALLESVNLSNCQEIANKLIKRCQFVFDMYAINLSGKEVQNEVDKYLPQLLNWLQTHRDKAFDDEPLLFRVTDIEENIWSAKFGVKGKIDLTVDVKENLSNSSRSIPMELKTGKSSFSSEHHGQVILYAMMMSDRLNIDVEEGWLVYLKDGKSKLITARHPEKRGLIQLRNELVAQMKAVFPKNNSIDTSFQDLPPIINNIWLCSRCPYINECTIFDSELQNIRQSSSTQQQLDPKLVSLLKSSINHLSTNHIHYFVKWCRLLLFEHADEEIGGEFSVGRILNNDTSKECAGPVFLNHTEEINEFYFILKFGTDHTRNISGQFIVGEPVIISTSNGRQIAITMASVYSVDPLNIAVISDRKIDSNLGPFRLDKYHSSKIALINFGVLSRLMIENPVCKKLRELIIDKRPPLFHKTLSKSKISSVKHILKPLNNAQRGCILKCLMAEDYVVLKGYPGTGKTSTIVALIRVLVSLGLRVLLSSYTHSSVDNVLVKLLPHSVDILRLGRSDRTRDELKQYCLEENLKSFTDPDHLRLFLNSKKVIATTCLSSGHACLSHLHFDVVIIDEAGQILQPTCIAPLLSMGDGSATEAAGKFVLVGDTKQLPPLVRNEQAKLAGLDVSLLQLLESVPGSACELDLQYRMNRVIVELCNNLVYHGAIKCANDQVATATLPIRVDYQAKFLCNDLPWLKTICSPLIEDSVLFLDTTELDIESDLFVNKNAVNYGEAELLLLIIRQFMQFDVNLNDIGIIAPFRNQVSHIRTLLRERLFFHSPKSEDLPVEVNTVDQYQGRDKSIILISFTKSIKLRLEVDKSVQFQSADILGDIRRLNVAISRAKHKLILIGSRGTLCAYDSMSNLFESLKQNQLMTVKLENSLRRLIRTN